MIPSESIELNRPTGSQILTGLHDLSDHLSCSIEVQGPDCHHAVVLWVSMAFQLIILTSLLLLYSFHQVCFVFYCSNQGVLFSDKVPNSACTINESLGAAKHGCLEMEFVVE